MIKGKPQSKAPVIKNSNAKNKEFKPKQEPKKEE